MNANHLARRGATQAALLLPELDRAYLRALNKATRRAASRFRSLTAHTVTASASWRPPDRDELADLDRVAEDIMESTGAIRLRVLKAAVTPILDASQIRFDLTNPLLRGVIERMGRHITDISETTRSDIMRSVQHAYDEGLSIDDAAKYIASGADVNAARASLIARTELIGATQGGSLAAVRLAGAAPYKTWKTAEDDRVRADHAEADGQTVPVDQPFSVGGEMLMFPGDQADGSPDEVVNCRCVVIYGDELGVTASADEKGTMNGMSEEFRVSAARDLPLAPRDRAWDGPAAEKRVRSWAGAADAPNRRYAQAFFWVEGDGSRYGDYHLGFADVVDGALVAVPRGVFACAGIVQGSRGADISYGDAVKAPIAAYYAKMRRQFDDDSITPPWQAAGKGVAMTSSVEYFAKAMSSRSRRHDFRGGKGEPCAICGQPYTDDVHYGQKPSEASTRGGMELAAVAVSADPATAPRSAETVTPGAEWRAKLLPLGGRTDDKRSFAPDAEITWRELPLSLMANTRTSEGHMGAEVAGRIDEIWVDDGFVWASGVFDTGPFGQEIARLVADKTLRGISVDLVDVDSILTKGDGSPLPEGDDADLLELLMGEDVSTMFTRAKIGATTIVPLPAFGETNIEAVSEETLVACGVIELRDTTLTASAAGLVPLQPPRDWFFTPEPGEPTPLTVTPEGHVYGHLALWNTCHIGLPGSCTTAPRSASQYAYFNLGSVQTSDGEEVACGQITLGTGHAPLTASRKQAAEHYDHTGSAMADVRAVDGRLGPWLSGALRPDTPASQVRQLAAAKLSGDWRAVNGALELVGVLAVNVPGFPVPRPRAHLAASVELGEYATALVAAGLITQLDVDAEVDALVDVASGGVDALVDAARLT